MYLFYYQCIQNTIGNFLSDKSGQYFIIYKLYFVFLLIKFELKFILNYLFILFIILYLLKFTT